MVAQPNRASIIPPNRAVRRSDFTMLNLTVQPTPVDVATTLVILETTTPFNPE